MKLINKIIFLIIFVFVLYVILIFVSPSFANNIAKPLWIEKFNKIVLDLKAKLDKNSTQDFWVENLENIYNKTLSWATDLKDKAIDGINWVRSSINDVRWWVNSTIETYEEVKSQIDDITETIDKTTKQIQEVKWSFDKVKNTFTSTGSSK